MVKTSRASKAPSSKPSAPSKRSSKTAASVCVGQPSTSATPYQIHTISGLNPQQHPPVQFVHLPYSYPYLIPAPTPFQARPLANPQSHPQSDSQSPPPQPHPSPSSSSTPTHPPTLESVFRETIQKLHDLETTLSNTQAVTKRALVRHQYELQKWKTHCLAFKQERDAARQTIKTLMEERARLLNRQPNIPLEMLPTTTAPSASTQPDGTSPKPEPVEAPLPASPKLVPILTDLASDQRKATRLSRRHSPYSSPTAGPSRRPSSSHSLPTFDCARWDPSVFPISPRARASSSPPSVTAVHTSPQPTPSTPVHPSVPSEASAIDERLQGLEFARFDPIRQEGDDTAFDVTWAPFPEPMELEYPLSRSPSIPTRPAHLDSDMELESDEEADPAVPHASTSRPASLTRSSVPPAKPTLNVDHVDLLFTPAAGRIWCRLCLHEHRSNQTAVHSPSNGVVGAFDPSLANFKPNAGWLELRDHWITTHPSESERLAGLNYEELWRLRESRSQSAISEA